MNREYFINLTFAVYKVTEVFPREEPLRLKIRAKANDVLSGLLVLENNRQMGLKTDEVNKRIAGNIEELRNYFELAMTEAMVNPKNFSVLQDEYNKIYQETSKDLKGKKAQFVVTNIPLDRHKKILNLFKDKEKLQIKDIQDKLPEISRRTIQRDLALLVDQGFLSTKGQHNEKFYSFTGNRGVTEV